MPRTEALIASPLPATDRRVLSLIAGVLPWHRLHPRPAGQHLQPAVTEGTIQR